MRSVFTLAIGLLLAYPTMVASKETRTTLREECSRDRCVYYKGSSRVFSVEKEQGTSRIVVRNSSREIIAKVKRDGSTLQIEKPRR